MLLLPSGLCSCFYLLCMLLLPSGLCRCLYCHVYVHLHAAFAIGALQMLIVTRLCLFACCSCHRGFAGACSDTFVFMCLLLLPSGLCSCLNLLCTLLLPRGFANACSDTFVFICMLLLPSGLCRCL